MRLPAGVRVPAILGAGPHGREIASFTGGDLYDDNLPGYLTPADAPVDAPTIIGAAWPKVRQQIASKYWGRTWRTDGNVVFPGARVGLDVTLAGHVHVNYNAVVAHGCRLGRFVTVCPGATLSGDVQVGEGVLIGAGATVIHGGITIGEWSTVGAGAVVVEDVPPFTTVAGVPARSL